ncbi:ABC transporter ATP-binding protein [Candidatus Dojkabacteria bacterium]|nr:ABC transporter ATP-binding protein [Candidatus Dojkabacteria bacterium]
MSVNNIALSLSGISKRYVLRHDKPTISDYFSYSKRTPSSFMALDLVSLEIKKGERLALIGVNGSGKTTLLKIMAGISLPSSGCYSVKGRVVSLIDLSAGFHPDLNGIDNIFLNALLLGMRNSEIKNKLAQIVEFADIGSFIHQPFYTYSDGMKLRLGFSVGIHSDPDIFIIDEHIAAGDESFKRKTGEKIRELFNTDKTVIVATHMFDFIRENCDKVVWLEKGRVKEYGGIKVLNNFINSFS